MALGRSPEYHWNQIISKSVYLFSRRSRWEGGGGGARVSEFFTIDTNLK